jgi:hypothetical protein
MRLDAGSTFRTIATLAATAALLATPWAATVAGADPVALRGVEADGPRVLLRLSNAGLLPRTVAVTVEARLVSGETSVATVEVELPGGSTSNATVPLAGTVREVIAVGIVLDDGVPF